MGPKLKKVVEEATQDDPIVGPTIQTLRDDLIAGQQDLRKIFTDFLEKNQASQDFSQASQNALQASQNAFQTTLLALLSTRQEVISSPLKDSPVTVIEPGTVEGREHFQKSTPDLEKSSSPHALFSMLHHNSPPSNEVEVKSLPSSFHIRPPSIPIWSFSIYLPLPAPPIPIGAGLIGQQISWALHYMPLPASSTPIGAGLIEDESIHIAFLLILWPTSPFSATQSSPRPSIPIYRRLLLHITTMVSCFLLNIPFPAPPIPIRAGLIESLGIPIISCSYFHDLDMIHAFRQIDMKHAFNELFSFRRDKILQHLG
jgi:hypothetical protein